MMFRHRVASLRIICTSSEAGSWSWWRLSSMWEYRRMVDSGLLISWATPAEIWPMDARRSVWISLLCAVASSLWDSCSSLSVASRPSTK